MLPGIPRNQELRQERFRAAKDFRYVGRHALAHSVEDQAAIAAAKAQAAIELENDNVLPFRDNALRPHTPADRAEIAAARAEAEALLGSEAVKDQTVNA